ncbi:MAG: VOC family protein [Armatimonadota bacterium]|nr:VOC family protein [Armatimonadota bacterium]
MKHLHTMIRVFDLEKSIHFYCEVLGFQLRSKTDHEKGRFTLVFLTPPQGGGEIELTHNWDQDKPYTIGNGYGHMAFEVDSMDEVGKNLEAHGLTFSWGPGKTPSGRGGMAFVVDPDGYEVELLER